MKKIEMVYDVPTLAEYDFGAVYGGGASDIAKPGTDKTVDDGCMGVPAFGE